MINQINKKLSLSIFTAVVSKLINILAVYITIPITLEYLSVEEFGIWMLITNFVLLLSISDLGVGVRLQNKISKKIGRNECENIGEDILVAYVDVFKIVVTIELMILIFFLSKYKISFVENIKYLTETITSISVYVMGIPFLLIHRILNGSEKMYASNVLNIISSVLSILSIFLAVHIDIQLQGLIFLYFLTPVIVNFLCSIFYFKMNRITINGYSRTDNVLTRIGGWSVVNQVIYNVKVNVPGFIVTYFVGLNAMASYSILFKVSSLVTIFINVSLQMLWPIYSTAYARRDMPKILSLMKVSYILTITISLLFSWVIYTYHTNFIEFWVGDKVEVDEIVLLWLLVTSTVINSNICLAVFLNGINEFKFQSFITMPLLVISTIVAIYQSKNFDVMGVVISLLILLELPRIPIYLIYTLRKVKCYE